MTLRCLSVMRDAWSLVRRRRMARVFFTRRSRGWYLWRTEAALHCLTQIAGGKGLDWNPGGGAGDET